MNPNRVLHWKNNTFWTGVLIIGILGAHDADAGRVERTRENRRTRPFSWSLAFFEAFGASGAGTNGVCSTSAPTGAKGETLTFTRASSATCTKTATGGLATTGIADGDLVVLSSNQSRVEYDSSGVLGLLVEAAGTNILLRSAELCNAAWSDVGTPDCLSDQKSGPFGTTTMDSITDNAAGAVEGRSQTIATTSATQFTVFCHVKGGTSTSATVQIVGTGSSTGDCFASSTTLSTTTSSIVSCTSPAAYAGTLTAVTAYVIVGTGASSDLGTVYVEGCDVKASAPYRTSHIPTAGAAVTRAVEVPYFVRSVPTTAGVCTAATLTSPSATAFASGASLFAPGLSSGTAMSGPYLWPYTGGVGTAFSIDGTGSTASATSYVSAHAAGTTGRYIASNNGSLLWRICKDASCTSGVSGTWSSPTYSHIKLTATDASAGGNIWSRIVVDPDWTRCGP